MCFNHAIKTMSGLKYIQFSTELRTSKTNTKQISHLDMQTMYVGKYKQKFKHVFMLSRHETGGGFRK